MTNTTPTDPAEQDWLEAFIESWIPIHVKDTLHVKEAKLDARKEFVAAITAHLQAAEKKGWSDGYHAGWNAYNESPYNPHEAKLTRLGKDSV